MDLNEFHRRLKKLGNKSSDEFMKDVSYETVNRLLAKTIKRTPVDTGLLRISWSIPENYAPPKKQGDFYVSTVRNKTEYASYVEYGHRQTPGRFVPAIGKKLKKSRTAPKFFLRKSVEEIEEELPDIVNIKIKSLEDNLWGRGKN